MAKKKAASLKTPDNLLKKKVFPQPATVPGDTVRDIENLPRLSQKDKELLKRIGIVVRRLDQNLQELTQVNFDRGRLYQEIDRASVHPLIGSSLELYADYSTAFNTAIHNSSMWITSDSTKYIGELTDLLDRIGIEEKIFDWAWTIGAYGDLFPKIEAQPALGVISIDDSLHPIDTSRVDYNGQLIGFYKTPLGMPTSYSESELEPPWDYVHFRLLGAKRKRPMYGDPLYSEFRAVHVLAPDVRQITTKYGSSLILNAIPVYKRLRLAEDSLLLARLTRGVTKYIYLLGVKGSNIEAVAEMMDEYSTMIKHARALDLSAAGFNFDSKANPMAAVEDLFMPVWEDVNNIKIEKLGEGGDVNIRWIVDIDDLRNQLAAALRTPLSLLGAYVQEASGALGSEAMGKLDIRFARSSRRLQRSIKQGVKRICQIHLAYMNMDPDPNLFDINMSETSTAEEKEVREGLDASIDTVAKFVDMIKIAEIPADMIEIIDYFNKKLLKLDDFKLRDYIKEPKLAEARQNEMKAVLESFAAESLKKADGNLDRLEVAKEAIKEFLLEVRKEQGKKKGIKLTENLDLKSALPLKEAHNGFVNKERWATIYGPMRIEAQNEQYNVNDSSPRTTGEPARKLSDVLPGIPTVERVKRTVRRRIKK